MTEKEKMLANQWYDANFDEELDADRVRAKDLCFELNQTRPSNKEKRKEILTELFGYEAENLALNSPFDTDYGWNVKLGRNVFVNSNCYFMDGGGITIGNDVFIGPSCGFYTAHHPLTYKERNKGLELAQPITIGNNIWFGGNVVVTPGVTIGDGSVIAAGSVVTKDVPENSLVAGVPAKVVRTITEEDASTINE
ncbi:sugar O-acetyltransferase [Staphylococcus croceilyticus]|uniref:Acetyltransferase n=1 Tax=Staphylococcus croceilyticus TaxID=319942 RepID=A0ABY2KF26_9STAP|nr:sugar O-acetyltransferase [Staphylococcus croceilyticus]PNZ70109.1 maltose acetyltransferase [Staphylococcus croceilyticus]TGA80525.1 sugar O-acetyltransferase [Staphylococcus croceilyticus]